MEERKSQKKDITNDAKLLFKEDKSKQETFEILVEKYGYAKDVADVLKYVPSSSAISKYGIWNTILLSVLILIAGFMFIGSPSIGIVVWYVPLIYAVATKRVKYYIWISVLAGLSISGFLMAIFINISANTNWFMVSLVVILFAFILTLSIYLRRKLCPEPEESRELYTNEDGNDRMRIVYQFVD